MALEKDHHLLDRALLGPRRANHLHPLAPHPRHLDQPTGVVVDHVERLRTKVPHNAFGRNPCPRPLISPLPKYFSIPATVAGSTVRIICTVNCLPYSW